MEKKYLSLIQRRGFLGWRRHVQRHSARKSALSTLVGKGVFAGHVSVIGRPVPNDWIELADQVPGRGLLVRLDDPSDLLQEGCHVLA